MGGVTQRGQTHRAPTGPSELRLWLIGRATVIVTVTVTDAAAGVPTQRHGNVKIRSQCHGVFQIGDSDSEHHSDPGRPGTGRAPGSVQAQSEPEAAWRSVYFSKGPGTSPLFNLVQDSELEPQVCVVLKAGCCRSEPRAQAASGRPGRGCPANGGAASCPGSGPTPSEPLAGGLPVAVKVRGPGRVPAGRNGPREKQTIRTAPECTPSLCS